MTNVAGSGRVRRAGPPDSRALARLRMALLQETGGPLAPDERDALHQANQRFLLDTLDAPEWSTWVIDGDRDRHLDGNDRGDDHGDDGEPVAMCSVVIWRRPPYPGNAGGLDAYLLNMYTMPSHRGQGLARQLLQEALADTRRKGAARLVLHATEAGRPIYAEAGFEASGAYMERWLTASR
jgi:GNAT superfamily N-acetyltransferase